MSFRPLALAVFLAISACTQQSGLPSITGGSPAPGSTEVAQSVCSGATFLINSPQPNQSWFRCD